MNVIESYFEFHFKASHRNNDCDCKCRNLHGHNFRGEVNIAFLQRDRSQYVNTDEVEKEINNVIKDLDYAVILDKSDALFATLKQVKDGVKLYGMDYNPTTENLALHLARKIYTETGYNVKSLILCDGTGRKFKAIKEDIQIARSRKKIEFV